MGIFSNVQKNKSALFIVTLIVLVGLLYFSLLRRKRIVEGFYNPPATTDTFWFPTSATTLSGRNEPSYHIRVYSAISPNIQNFRGPPNMPQDIQNAVQKTLGQWQIYKDIFQSPGDFIRIDSYTHKAYMRSLNPTGFDVTKRCMKEYTTDKVNQIPYFKSAQGNFTLSRNLCNIEVTPTELGKLPLKVANAIRSYIFSEQRELTIAKEYMISSTALSGLDAKNKGRNFFSDDLRTKRNEQRTAALEELKTIARQTLQTAAESTGQGTAQDLITSATKRNAAKAVAETLKSITPYGLASTLIRESIQPLFNAVAGKISQAIAESEGLECPAGFVEGGDITQANSVFSAVNDIFPNPISDLTNSALKPISCVRYSKNPDDTPKVETTLKSRCGPKLFTPPFRFCFAPEPTLMDIIPQVSTTSVCEMDKNINQKLQLVSNWVSETSLNSAPSRKFYVIQNFIYLCNQSEYFLECSFRAIDYGKSKESFLAQKQNPNINTYEVRFYFNKNACNYTVFGYTTDNLAMINQFNCGETIDFAPINNLEFLVQYGIDNNQENPFQYAYDNRNNTTLITNARNQVAAAAAELAEKTTLLNYLNPSNAQVIKTAIQNMTKAELQERKDFFIEFNLNVSDPKYSTLTMPALRDEREKLRIIKVLMPTYDQRYADFYNTLSLTELRSRRDNKALRDSIISDINPTQDSNRKFDLTKLSLPDLQQRKVEFDNRIMMVNYLNPRNDTAIKSNLESLSTAALQQKYNTRLARADFNSYFNPNNVETIFTWLDSTPIADLTTKKSLIQQLTQNITEIQTLYLLTNTELQNRIDDRNLRQTIYTYFNPDNFASTNTELDKHSTTLLNERMRYIKKLREKNPGIRPQDFMQFSYVPSRYPNSKIKTDYAFLGITNWDT